MFSIRDNDYARSWGGPLDSQSKAAGDRL